MNRMQFFKNYLEHFLHRKKTKYPNKKKQGQATFVRRNRFSIEKNVIFYRKRETSEWSVITLVRLSLKFNSYCKQKFNFRLCCRQNRRWRRHRRRRRRLRSNHSSFESRLNGVKLALKKNLTLNVQSAFEWDPSRCLMWGIPSIKALNAEIRTHVGSYHPPQAVSHPSTSKAI